LRVRHASTDAAAPDILVLGGSVAGLLAAAAVAPFAARVRVVDRDDLDTDLRTPRDGTPQAGHSHAILMGGIAAMDEILPGFSGSLVDDGALLVDVLGRTRWIIDCHEQVRATSGEMWLLASRTLLEARLRRRVLALGNVTAVGGVDIVRPQLDASSRRVSGVVVAPRDAPRGGDEQLIGADLVIDATGRASRTVAWLRSNGFAEPPETVVDARVRYVTRRFHHAPGVLDGLDAEIVGPQPASRRCGIVLRQERDTWTVTLVGRFGEEPPLDLDGFRAYARSLPGRGIAEVAEGCQPASAPLRATFPASRWRHWERLPERPAGLVVVGDAVASVNPAVGQGMTMSALQVRELHRLLSATGFDDIEARCASAFADAVAGPWEMGTLADASYVNAGSVGLPGRLLEAYLDRVIAVGTRRPDVARSLARVLHLLDGTPALLSPSVLWRVLGPGSRRAVADARAVMLQPRQAPTL
jgi:2-polyprenyl-6-methoxyphenol hydroxylase-like FAD-dependent oxidoreductase